MVRNPLPMFAALALVGCASEVPAGGQAASEEAGAAAKAQVAKVEAAPQVAQTGARDETVSTPDYAFSYSYPARAGSIPGLRALLDADLARRKATTAEFAEQGRRDARENGFPFSQHDFGMGWDVVADLPGWLSLSAGFSTYTGGAHPNSGFDALLWDKRAGKVRTPTELFRSERAFAEAVRADFCKALDKERAERRDGVEAGIFDDCVEPTEAVIILGSSNRKTFDRIGFLIAPYIAGPYAEGSYDVTLPVSKAVLERVKPEFRDSFAIGK